MRASLNWLSELCGGARLSAREVSARLTMAGLEIEGTMPQADFSGVVVAAVRGSRPHPDAAKLTLVDVWAGSGEVTQVVCGAPNVPQPGGLVAWARPGARLPKEGGGVLEIAARPVRGVVSPGMLCAEDELGVGTSHEGILIFSAGDGLKPGDDLREKLGPADVILEVNVTPNRPDCLGHVGIAREIAAAGLGALTLPRHPSPPASGSSVPVEIRDPAACPRYTALMLDQVKVGASPLWLRLRLSSLGVRAISNVVDATNLAMLETGQPLHAFDLDKLTAGKIVVRDQLGGQILKTLDGEDRRLEPADVVICDDEERPVALAGVMGGADSEVSVSTTRVLLECAHFDPARIRRTAKRIGLHSEASHRFERGTDPNGLANASLRCAAMIAGAKLAGPMTDVYPRPTAPRHVTLRPERTRALIGPSAPAADEQAELLSRIGLRVERAEVALAVTVPTFRPDLTREVDLIEEVVRLYGYDRIAPTVPTLRAAPGGSGDTVGELARAALAAAGFDETISYAFVPPAGLQTFGFTDGRAHPLKIDNPLREEHSALRTTLLHGLLSALKRNQDRGQTDVRLFEIGQIFLPRADDATADELPPQQLPIERRLVSGVLGGQIGGWLEGTRDVDFFDLKGAVAALLSAFGHELDVGAANAPWLHPGVQAEARVRDRTVGLFGEMHPDVRRRMGLSARVFAFELDVAAIGVPERVLFQPLPRFPQVARDLSFFIDVDVEAAEIREAIDALRDPLCVEVRVLEDYRETGRVPEGKKGMLWSFVYRAADRTLTDVEVKPLHEGLVTRLAARLDFERR
jgi:phenylalanyl-tRNA synthetase beta chain